MFSADRYRWKNFECSIEDARTRVRVVQTRKSNGGMAFMVYRSKEAEPCATFDVVADADDLAALHHFWLEEDAWRGDTSEIACFEVIAAKAHDTVSDVFMAKASAPSPPFETEVEERVRRALAGVALK